MLAQNETFFKICIHRYITTYLLKGSSRICIIKLTRFQFYRIMEIRKKTYLFLPKTFYDKKREKKRKWEKVSYKFISILSWDFVFLNRCFWPNLTDTHCSALNETEICFSFKSFCFCENFGNEMREQDWSKCKLALLFIGLSRFKDRFWTDSMIKLQSRPRQVAKFCLLISYKDIPVVLIVLNVP